MYELVRSLILVLFWMVLVSANDANDFNGAISRKNAEIAFLQEKLTKDPNSFMTAIELGQVFQSKARLTSSLADYRAAEDAFRKSLGIYSEHNVDAKIGLATALASQHRFREAHTIISPLVKQESDKSTVWAVAGDIAFQLGEYQFAQKHYEQFLKLKPGLESWSRMAKMSLQMGRWDEARVFWEKCCALPVGADPEPSAWAFTMHGDLYFRCGNVYRARQLFEQALGILPGFPLAIEHLAETYELEENYELAAELLDSALVNNNAHYELMLRKAVMLEQTGKASEGIKMRRKAIKLLEEELAKGNPGHRRVLAEAILELGQNPKQVLKLAEEELRDRGDIGAEMLMARALVANGRAPEALPHIQRALMYNSFEPELLKQAVELYSLAGAAADAAHTKEKLEQFNPGLCARLSIENVISK